MKGSLSRSEFHFCNRDFGVRAMTLTLRKQLGPMKYQCLILKHCQTHSLTHKLNESMEQSPSQEADDLSPSKEIPRIL